MLELGLKEGSWRPVLTVPGHIEGVGAEEGQFAAGLDDLALLSFPCQTAQPDEG